ncbi:hypothetical protein RDWZM_007517 [Blomia tropicalis]|uniref:Uncharacterized protein n=1 Tax=Blomia tropicalis TaxID=40697 RepID=A0A9Q0LZA4_BLOTA|nr:hypothetical protein RDWZM_007517 [Blomia tropicalis]
MIGGQIDVPECRSQSIGWQVHVPECRPNDRRSSSCSRLCRFNDPFPITDGDVATDADHDDDWTRR